MIKIKGGNLRALNLRVEIDEDEDVNRCEDCQTIGRPNILFWAFGIPGR